MAQRNEDFGIGEHVYKGSERGVIVELKNRSTGAKFKMVWILNGPRKNQREYPERGWSADEVAEYDRPDYDNDGLSKSEAKDMLHRPWRFRETR